jgi:mRNA interferase RelE/StbE
MDGYEVLITVSAGQEIIDVPKAADRRRIVSRIRGLAADPRPVGSKQLAGDQRMRVRQGDYRIVYEIENETRRVVILKVGHRRDVYR